MKPYILAIKQLVKERTIMEAKSNMNNETRHNRLNSKYKVKGNSGDKRTSIFNKAENVEQYMTNYKVIELKENNLIEKSVFLQPTFDNVIFSKYFLKVPFPTNRPFNHIAAQLPCFLWSRLLLLNCSTKDQNIAF